MKVSVLNSNVDDKVRNYGMLLKDCKGERSLMSGGGVLGGHGRHG
jgi:hypothetical protein